MRKLRSDITLKEAWEWIDDLKNKYSCEFKDYMYDLAVDVARADKDAPISYDTYPDSFYEQPPGGSYGKFSDAKWGEAWGYLFGITSEPIAYVMKNSRVGPYDNFTPGLPQDVDEFGYPKED